MYQMACDLCTGCWHWYLFKYGLYSTTQVAHHCTFVCEHDDRGVACMGSFLARFKKTLYTIWFIFVAALSNNSHRV